MKQYNVDNAITARPKHGPRAKYVGDAREPREKGAVGFPSRSGCVV